VDQTFCETQIFCTLTQGAYGNKNGRYVCDDLDMRRLELINYLIGNTTPLTVGWTGIYGRLTFGVGQGQCVINSLPAGGPSTTLTQQYTFSGPGSDLSCAISPAPPTTPKFFKNDGVRFANTALGQMITLGLNLRLDANLGALEILDVVIWTTAATACDGEPVEGAPSIDFGPIPQRVLDTLKSPTAGYVGGATVNNLYILLNKVLGGVPGTGISVSDINAAAGTINEAFDECRSLDRFDTAESFSRLSGSASREIPTEYTLEVNYPKPFNPTTVIEYSLPEASRVSLKVYNVLGQEVATLVNDVLEAGYQAVTWNASNNSNISLASGVYIYRLQATSVISAREFTKVKKMLLVK